MELSIFLLSLSELADKIQAGFVAITPLLGIVLPFILSKLGGFKTKIFAALTVLSSIIMFVNDAVLPGLSQFFGITTSTVMGFLTVINGIAIWVLRNYSTGAAAPISELPQALRTRKK